MKIMIINGPNMNLLGIREPDIYGLDTYDLLVSKCKEYGDINNIELEFYQSNIEGELVNAIQKAFFDKYDGIIINPAAYTHTSVAIHDALKATNIPTIEVHISKVDEREEYRKINLIRDCCIFSIQGKGIEGYIEALAYFVENKK